MGSIPRIGRPRIRRVSLFCHTGFEIDKQFLLYLDSCRRGLRQEYFRRYLSVGYSLGQKQIESGTPPSEGQSRLIRIIIPDDDPLLCPFLDEYLRRGSFEWRGQWVRETILSGFEFLSGNAGLSRENAADRRQEVRTEKGIENTENPLEGLFR